jgi:hypothetical protein
MAEGFPVALFEVNKIGGLALKARLSVVGPRVAHARHDKAASGSLHLQNYLFSLLLP